MSKKFEVGKSKIHGVGVISKKNFKRGDIVFILKGKLKKLQIKSSKDSAQGPNWIGIFKNQWLDPNYPYMYLNHSCEPNMGIKGKVTFMAMKDIKIGEELTFDYATTEDDVFWKFNCLCKTKKCRKLIRSIQFLPKKTYQHYSPYIPKYFAQVYNKSVK